MTRERWWLILVEDGRIGGTLGRHTDPDDQYLLAVEKSRVGRKIGDWGLSPTDLLPGLGDVVAEVPQTKLATSPRDGAAVPFLEGDRQRSAGHTLPYRGSMYIPQSFPGYRDLHALGLPGRRLRHVELAETNLENIHTKSSGKAADYVVDLLQLFCEPTVNRVSKHASE